MARRAHKQSSSTASYSLEQDRDISDPETSGVDKLLDPGHMAPEASVQPSPDIPTESVGIPEPGLNAELVKRVSSSKFPTLEPDAAVPNDGSGESIIRGVVGIDDRSDLAERLARWHRAELLDGDQRFIASSILGRGGQGLVFAVEDREAGREVAVKVLRGDRVRERHARRFINEARITAQLEHPGVVPVHDIGKLPDGAVYYVMKRIAGRSLEEFLELPDRQRPSHFQLLQMVLQVCDTMAFAHDRGVIHRDLKPSNIMVGDYGEVLVVDWGLAKVLPSSLVDLAIHNDDFSEPDLPATESDGLLTLEGHAVGTPAYMSPEQATGDNKEVMRQADIYALGVILYEVLCGRSPYQVTGSQAIVEAVAKNETVSLLSVARHTPRPLNAIVSKAMAFEARQRYRNVADLAIDLRHYLAGEPVSCYQENIAERCIRRVKKNKATVMVSSLVALCAVLAALTWWQLSSWDHRQRVQQLLTTARQTERSGELDKAIGLYERVLALAPAQADALDGRVRSRALLSDQTAQLASLEAERRNAERAEGLWTEAEVLLERGHTDDLEQAKDLMAQAMELFAPHSARREQALVARDAIQAQLAQRALDSRRERSDALLAAAEQEILANAWSRAEAHLLAASELVPNDARMQRLRQQIHNGIALEQEERQAADAARLMDSAQQHAAQRRYPQAIGSVQAALQIYPSEQASTLLETLLTERDQHFSNVRAVKAVAKSRDLLKSAQVHLSRVQALDDQRHALLEAVAELRGQPSQAQYLADLRGQIAQLEQQSSAESVSALNLLFSAHREAPELADPRLALVNYFHRQVVTAEQAGRSVEATALAAQGLIYDVEQRHPLFFGGLAEISASEHSLRLQRQGTEDWITIERGTRQRIAAGSYLFEAYGSVLAARLLHRGQRLEVVFGQPPQNLPANMRYIPAGTIVENPAVGAEGELDVGRFLLAEREVTNAQWLEFVNDRSVLNTIDQSSSGILRLAPRLSFDDREGLWHRDMDVLGNPGPFQLQLRSGKPLNPQAPVMGISAEDVEAYVAWRRQRDGLAWRLPTASEWTLAAQGGDGRQYPWGAVSELSWCYSQTVHQGGELVLLPTASFAQDTSVNQVADLAGSVCEMTSTAWPDNPGLVVYCGGSWADHDEQRFTTTGRRALHRRRVSTHVGFRLALSLEQGEPKTWSPPD